MSTTPVPTKAMHQWAAGGVSGYPVKHPLIGQGDFFNKFQHFLRLNTLEEFVQVFAAIAAWGVGNLRRQQLDYSVTTANVTQGSKVIGELLSEDAAKLAAHIKAAGKTSGMLTVLANSEPDIADVFQIKVVDGKDTRPK